MKQSNDGVRTSFIEKTLPFGTLNMNDNFSLAPVISSSTGQDILGLIVNTKKLPIRTARSIANASKRIKRSKDAQPVPKELKQGAWGNCSTNKQNADTFMKSALLATTT